MNRSSPTYFDIDIGIYLHNLYRAYIGPTTVDVFQHLDRER